jgi:hypothetical protein
MSKKIDSARKELTKALKKHAEVVGANAVSLKKSQRAASAVHNAAVKYAAAVEAKTGLPNPLSNIGMPGLDTKTLASLAAERDAIAAPKKN